MSTPVLGAFYLHNDKIYRLVKQSRGTDQIFLCDKSDGKEYVVRYSVFQYGYERVFKVTDIARMLERTPRSIYRYESSGVINKPKCYIDTRGREVRYYRQQDVLDIHDLISQVHQGKPRKDGKITNNTISDKYSFRLLIKERFK